METLTVEKRERHETSARARMRGHVVVDDHRGPGARSLLCTRCGVRARWARRRYEGTLADPLSRCFPVEER